MSIKNYLPKTITQIKYAQRIQKERTKVKPLTTLNKEDYIRTQELLTNSSHALEYLNGLMDQLLDIGVIPAKHLIYEYKVEVDKLEEFFLNSAFKEGNYEERTKQQLRFEKLFQAISKMKAKQINKLFETLGL